ncbi:hypothetical protein HH310_09760 [Actinoplanes sp. TBRC 11911]|nr:hypothetical protein [Actinoplanes sp. TBRC 11911]
MRGRLAEELGIEPGAALQEAHRRVLSQTVAPGVGAAPARVDVAAPARVDVAAPARVDAAAPVRVDVAAPAGVDPAALARFDRAAPARVDAAALARFDPAGLAAAPAPALVAPVTPPAQLPPDLPFFAGRESELAALGDLIREPRTSPLVVALDGIGGAGKSTLAVHFAHSVADQFPDGQFVVDLRGGGGVSDEPLRSLLDSLGMRVLPATFDARVGAYRSLTAGKRALVLLDNARDAEQVRSLLPNAPGSLVLVTSREPLTGLAAFAGAHLLHVGLPDARSARDLLRRRLERTHLVDEGALAEIVELCGRLPLALALLAGRLGSHPHLPLETVVARLREHGGLDVAAGESGSRATVFRASIRLADVMLATGDLSGSCRAWRTACDVMYTMRPGGTSVMREAVDEIGGRIAEISYAGAQRWPPRQAVTPQPSQAVTPHRGKP